MRIRWSSILPRATLALAALLPAAALATALSCGPTGGTGVFNVFENGKVSLNHTYTHATSTCNITFGAGTDKMNVTAPNFYSPQQPNQPQTRCNVTPSDQTLSKLTLPPQPSYPSEPDIAISNANWNNDQLSDGFSINGTAYKKCTLPNGSGWILNSANCSGNPTFITHLKNAQNADVLRLPTINTTEYFTVVGPLKSLTGSGIRADIEHGVVIGSINVTNQSRLRLQGDLKVQSITLADTYRLEVASQLSTGISKARLYTNTFTISNGNGGCINFNGDCQNPNLSSTNAPSIFTAQQPERLSIYVYSGHFAIPDHVKMAAAVYVHNGNLTFTANGGNLFVGEAVANNISTANNAYLAYRNTNEFADLIGGNAASGAAVITGAYSPARPALPTVARTGDLAFMVYQTDRKASAESPQHHSGTLKAFALNANGTTATTATWDANARAADNGGATHRATRLHTNSAPDAGNTGTFSLISNAADLDELARNRLINGPGASLSTDWTGFYGKPHSTAPLIVGDLVLFATSDGLLYALDKASGDLQWGWMPHVLLNEVSTLEKYRSFLEGEPKPGQLSSVVIEGTPYVLGSVLGGRLHYSLKLTSAGALDRVVWLDHQTSGAAPTHRVEAPVIATTRALYLGTGNSLKVRPISATSAPSVNLNLSGFSATSAPTLIPRAHGSHTLFLGDSLGRVHQATLSSSGTLGNNPWTTLTPPNQTQALLAGEPVRYVVYTRTSEAEYLTLQSDQRITTLKAFVSTQGNNSNTTWRELWTSTRSDSKQWRWSGTNHSTRTEVTGTEKIIPSLPAEARLSDRSSTVAGFILSPVTLPSESGCQGEARLYKFSLDPEVALYKVFYNGSELSSHFVSLGSGEALQAQPMLLNGTLMAQGHSPQNTGGAEGLDNLLSFRPIPPNSGPGRRGWREIIRD